MAQVEKKTITAYKGFDQDLKCRGFQYEVGKEYEMDGNIECCNRGFHACESPLEVLDYYFLLDNGNMARFCEVEQSGTFDKENEDKLFLDIEHAIDAYIENKCKDLLETRISYEHGYEIKLSIKKIKV